MFSRSLVDSDTLEWQFESYEWLIDRFSSGPGLPDSQLWLPIEEHFPTGDGDLAGRLFGHVRTQYGFPPGDVFDLVEVDVKKPEHLGGIAMVQTSGAMACGTYEAVRNDTGGIKEVIHFDRNMSATELVSTFAHELAHAVHWRARGFEDIDDELYELFTDLTAVYFGYGVFLANDRFEMSAYSSGGLAGWNARGAGYLPEADLIMATAIFAKIKALDSATVITSLKPRLQKVMKKAFKQLERHEARIDALREREPAFKDWVQVSQS